MRGAARTPVAAPRPIAPAPATKRRRVIREFVLDIRLPPCDGPLLGTIDAPRHCPAPSPARSDGPTGRRIVRIRTIPPFCTRHGQSQRSCGLDGQATPGAIQVKTASDPRASLDLLVRNLRYSSDLLTAGQHD